MTKAQEMLEIADAYEAGLQKMIACGYEEYGPEPQRKHRLIIEALRLAAQADMPAIQPQQMRDAIELTEDMLEAGAQALADDVWHPPIKLSLMAKHEASKFRRQALITLKAATAFSRPDLSPTEKTDRSQS